MIRANEVRIGNWVQNHNACPIKVNAEFFKMLERAGGESGGTFGIPLTPEILKKASFKRVDDEFYHNWQYETDNDGFSVKFAEDKYWLSNDVSDAWCYTLREIKFLHQLQNSVFALSDKELEINL